MAGLFQIFEGLAEGAAGAALDIWAGGAGGLGNMLIGMGVGTALSGVGSLIGGSPIKGKSVTERNPISPWKVGYGRTAPKNDVIYLHQWGANGQMIDMIICVYDHPCASIDEVLFDEQRVQIDTAAIPTSAAAGYTIASPAPGSGTSFTPAQQTNILATSIAQSNDIVTIVLPQDIPFLTSGDPIVIKGTGGNTYNATFPVSQVLGRGGGFGGVTFTILNGAPMPTTVQCSTKWVDYGRTVYFEPLLGNQLLGQTFIGMAAGTPWQGTGKLCTPLSPQNAGSDINFPAQANPWTPACSGQGKTLVFLRINVDKQYYPSGLPLISFRSRGKNNIWDPRVSTATGVKLAALSAAGSGYQVPAPSGTASALLSQYDILTLVQAGASGAQVAVTGVNGSGGITSFVVINPGTGYTLGACTATGGHGSSATFQITALGGASGVVSSVSVGPSSTGLPTYQVGDVLTLLQQGSSSDATVTVTSVNGKGQISGVSLTTAGTSGYISGWATTSGGHGSGAVFAINAGALVYSENPVLCIADFLTSSAGNSAPGGSYFDTPVGFGCLYGTDVPLSPLGTMATICDTSTTLAAGGTEPLYSCNGQFDTEMLRGEILQSMLTSCAGRLVPEAPFVIQPGYWQGTNTSPTDLQAIAAGPFRWKGPTVHELYNAVKGTFVSPFNRWKSTDYPAYMQDADHGYSGPAIYNGDINLTADGGQRRFFELNQPFCVSSRQAQKVAKVEMLRRRWANLGIPPNPGSVAGFGGMGEFACHMAAYAFAPLDIFAGTVAFMGLSSQDMEVTLARLKGEVRDGAMALGVELELQLTDSSIYTWNTNEEQTPQGFSQVHWPAGLFTDTQPLPWSAGYAAPLIGDAVYPATNATTLAAAISSPLSSPGTITLSAAAPQAGSYLLIGSEWFLVNYGGGTTTPNVTGGQFGSTATTHSSGAAVTMPAGPSSFGLAPAYKNEGDGSIAATLQVKGYVPINALDAGIEAPQIVCTPSTTGGALPAGTYVIGLAARDNGTSVYGISDYQVLAVVNVGGSGAGSIAVGITWGSGDDGGDLYIGLWEPGQAYTMHWNQAVPSSASSATITLFDQTQPGGPDPDFAIFEPDWWEAVHTGLFLEQVQAVTATTVTLGSYTAGDVTANQFAGYILSLQGKINPSTLIPSGEIPILNMPIASNTASSGTPALWTMTIGTNSAGKQLPPLNQILEVGDWVVMRGNYTFGASSFYDTNIANAYYPSGDTGVEATHLAVVLTGANAGDIQTLTGGAGSAANPWTLSQPWTITPSPGDVVVIISSTMRSQQYPGWQVRTPGLVGPVAWPDFTNLVDQAWLVRMRTVDVNGNHSDDRYSPMRDFLMLPAGAMGTTITA